MGSALGPIPRPAAWASRRPSECGPARRSSLRRFRRVRGWESSSVFYGGSRTNAGYAPRRGDGGASRRDRGVRDLEIAGRVVALCGI